MTAHADRQTPPPVTTAGSYRPPLWLRSGHVQTIWPSLFRRVELPLPDEERIDTPDGDFLDLDWYRAGHPRVAVLCHGLEGNSRRPYMQGMARALLHAGWDVLCWNFRSCGRDMNRLPRFYHSGATDDLAQVIQHALSAPGAYRHLVLGGFSMGGNLALVYLGERAQTLDARITAAFVFSVPCDLGASAEQLARAENRLYMARFLRDLRQKMKVKHPHFPDQIDLRGLERMRTFHEFDDRFTAPLHGFRSARHYWESCSSRHFLGRIRIPALLVNAADDPFLPAACYPHRELGRGGVVLEVPRWGGHVGFMSRDPQGCYWSERRVLAFLHQHAPLATTDGSQIASRS